MKLTHISLALATAASSALACSSSPDGSAVILSPDAGWAPAPGPSTSGSGSGPATATPDAGSPGSSTGTGSSSSGTGSGPVTSGTSGIPCNVATLLAAKCTTCHADPLPSPSYLASLVTLAELKAPSKLDPTKNEVEESVALMTLTSGATAMPPTSGSPAADIAVLQAWISSGYAAGAACDGGAPPSPTGVFTNAPPYAAPTKACSGKHNAGQECMGCHSGNSDNAFLMGGTLYDGSGNAVVNAEVRLVDSTGKATSVYSCQNGNFYIGANNGGTLNGPATVGVRNATTTQTMVTTLSSGSQPPASSGGACNACHASGGTTTPVHLP